MPISEDDLSLLEQLHSEATPGPWRSMVEGRDHDSGSSFIMTKGEDIYLTGATDTDQDLVAAMRSALPELLAEVRRARRKDPPTQQG
jgi:hypothetical protein